MSRRVRIGKAKIERRKRIVTYVTVEREVKSAGPEYVALGKVLRELRRRLGMTQEFLAAKIGLSRTSIVNIEMSRQTVQLADIFAFARALNIKPEKLVAMVAAEMSS